MDDDERQGMYEYCEQLSAAARRVWLRGFMLAYARTDNDRPGIDSMVLQELNDTHQQLVDAESRSALGDGFIMGGIVKMEAREREFEEWFPDTKLAS